MPTVEPFPAGGYRFIVRQFQYSGGVAAEPGFRIERATSRDPRRWPKVLMRSKPTSPASDVRRPRSAPASCAPRRTRLGSLGPLARKWDQRFESAFLHRRVCKLSVPRQRGFEPGPD
jgi:hypothetical protein